MADANSVTEVATQQINMLTKWWEANQGMIIDYSINAAVSLVILIVGWICAKFFAKLLEKFLTKNKAEITIVHFISEIVKYALIAFVVVASLNNLGIQTTSFVAIIGAAGLAIGLALQGSLSNFAAGFLLIAFRPIKKGEYINAAGVEGNVSEVSVFTTTLLTNDNKVIIVPNSSILNGNITNFARMPERRVDVTVRVTYEADLPKVQKILQEVADQTPGVLKDKGIAIVVADLAPSSLNLQVRMWTNTADYWAVAGSFNESVTNALRANNIKVPVIIKE